MLILMILIVSVILVTSVILVISVVIPVFHNFGDPEMFTVVTL